MRLTEPELRRLLANEVPRSRASCPSAETILKGHEGTLGPAERSGVADHVAGCADCAEELALLRPLPARPPPHGAAAPARSTGPGEEDRPSPPSGWWSRWYSWAAACAGAAALIAISAVLWPSPERSSPVTRGAPEPSVRFLVPEGQVLPRDRFVLRWTAVAPGARYSLTVATPDLHVLHEAHALRRPEYQVPASSLSSVPKGGRIYWRVVTTLPDGRVLTSGLASIRID